MKNTLYVLLALTVFFSTLYFADKYNKQHTHPTLNGSATSPDEYLVDMVVAHQRGNKASSLTLLEQAIESCWLLEKDVDHKGAMLMEEAVLMLESLHKRLTIDAADDSDVREVYRKSLKILARVELLVAENQMKADDIYQAKVALRYVTVHLKNSMLFLNRAVDYKQIKALKSANNQIEQLIVNDDLTIQDFQTGDMISLLKQY